jgi:hypothetical protein
MLGACWTLVRRGRLKASGKPKAWGKPPEGKREADSGKLLPPGAGAFSPRGFFPTGLFPHGVFSPRGFFPTGLFPTGLFPHGAFPHGAFPHGAFSPRGFFPTGFFPHGAFSPRGFSPRGFSPRGFSPTGLFPHGAFPPRLSVGTRLAWRPPSGSRGAKSRQTREDPRRIVPTTPGMIGRVRCRSAVTGDSTASFFGGFPP